MKNPVLIAAAAGAALSFLTFAPAAQAAMTGMSSVPAQAAEVEANGQGLVETVGRRGRHVRRGVAIGAGIVTLGVLGALAAKEARANRYYGSRYYGDRHYYRSYPSYGSQCHRWRRWCRNGNDRACWKFDTRC